MTEAQHRGHLDCLLADFAAVKSEISRRSDLQRVVVAAYLGLVALSAREGLSGEPNSGWIPALWASCFVALQYYVREGLEIGRLSSIINRKIAPSASALLGAGDAHLFPSETDPEATDTKHLRRRYDRQFFWIAFFAAPLAITAWFVMSKWERKDKLVAFGTLYPWLACLSLVAASCTFVLLRQWFWLNRKPANPPLQPTSGAGPSS